MAPVATEDPQDGGWRISADIGGTFTVLLVDPVGRCVGVSKVLTTQEEPAVGLQRGIEELLTERPGAQVHDVVHGTTLVTNALIERRGARTALLTTEGFGDVLEIGQPGQSTATLYPTAVRGGRRGRRETVPNAGTGGRETGLPKD